jgi:hypothetical protein
MWKEFVLCLLFATLGLGFLVRIMSEGAKPLACLRVFFLSPGSRARRVRTVRRMRGPRLPALRDEYESHLGHAMLILCSLCSVEAHQDVLPGVSHVLLLHPRLRALHDRRGGEGARTAEICFPMTTTIAQVCLGLCRRSQGMKLSILPLRESAI